MEANITTLLEALNSLTVNTSLWALRESFNSFFHHASRVPVERIDTWIQSLESPPIQDRWNNQRQMKHPHLFLYAMFNHFKFQTLREGDYHRVALGQTVVQRRKDDFDCHLPVADLICQPVLSLPFYEGVAFLGQLAGAWMLTCPELTIRGERNVERVGKWQTGRETTAWRVPSAWFEMFDPENELQKKLPADELQLLFTLDSLLNFAFEDYDLNNTYD